MSLEDTLRFWELDVGQSVWYLDWKTGEELQAKLDARKQDERQSEQMMFESVEDVSGNIVVVRVDLITDLSSSTPESRARGKDPDGPYEAIRRLSIEKAKRKWGRDAEEYEK